MRTTSEAENAALQRMRAARAELEEAEREFLGATVAQGNVEATEARYTAAVAEHRAASIQMSEAFSR